MKTLQEGEIESFRGCFTVCSGRKLGVVLYGEWNKDREKVRLE